MLLRAKVPHHGSPPCRQAVGIKGNPQTLGHAFIVQRRDLTLQVPLKQTYLLHMVEQAPANLGGGWWRGTNQHRLPYPCFQQFDPLRHCRLRQAQNLCSTLKTSLLNHGGQGRK